MFIVYYKAFTGYWYNGYCTKNFYDDGKLNYWLIPGTWEE